MRTGVLEAEGDITAKFLEDCNIFSRNNIQAEYIINSEVSCGHDLTFIGKKRGILSAEAVLYINCMNVKGSWSAQPYRHLCDPGPDAPAYG